MFCPPSHVNRTQQVWPGGGIELFSGAANSVKLTVVSTYSKYLNLERWYFTSNAGSLSESKTLTIANGSTPDKAVLDSAAQATSWDLGLSYEDRAILTEIDWNRFNEPPMYPIQDFTCITKVASLRPVIISSDGGAGATRRDTAKSPTQTPNLIVCETPIQVWIQFWIYADALTKISWAIETRVGPDARHLPAGFEIPETDAEFDPGTWPNAGWCYSGGLRPTPWPT